MLEGAARTGSITLVHATPVVHLLASVFGVDVSFAEDRALDGSPADVARLQELAAARAQLQDVERTEAVSHSSNGRDYSESSRRSMRRSTTCIVTEHSRIGFLMRTEPERALRSNGVA